MKRFLAMVLVLMLVVVGCGGYQGGIGTPVYAEEYRNGYQLKAELENKSGVKIKSSFILSNQDHTKLSVDQVKKELQITPNIRFKVEEVGNGVRIIPEQSLMENKVYAFAFDQATWLMQTENEFFLRAVMPRPEATEVPIDTGIEFLFSTGGASELEKYISISPKVEGHFESKGEKVVFVPKSRLAHKTVYTVTIKAGLPLAGSEKKLKQDTVFQFETANKTSIFGQQPEYEYLDFNSWQNEIGVGEQPVFTMSYYNSKSEEREHNMDVKAVIYQFANADQYLKAVSGKANTPTWANYVEDRVSTKNLTQAGSFQAKIIYDKEIYQYRLELPSKMKAGYYLAEVTKGKQKCQTFLQATDISTYYRSTETEDVVWLHQVKTAKLLANAEITVYQTLDADGNTIDAKSMEQVKTNGDGVGILHKKSAGPIALKIKSGAMESIAYFRNWDYRKYGWGFERENLDILNYWNLLQLDRRLYQPDDQLHIFGFMMPRYAENSNRVLNKEERIKQVQTIKTVKVEIVKNHWYYFRDGNEDLAFVSKELPVEDGFYTGDLTLPKLAPGNYQLRVKVGDQLLETTFFTVEEYVKPAYKIEIEKNKKAIFWNQKIDFTVKTKFFEGTPVSDLDYHYDIYGGSDDHGQGKTNQLGEASFSYQPNQLNSDWLIQHKDIHVSASLPESGEITGTDKLKVFLRNADLEADAKLKGNKGILSGEMYGITLDRLNNGTAKDDYDYKDKPVSNQNIKVEIYKHKWVKNEIGQHYDYINKVVIKNYEWHEVNTLLETKNFTTNQAGKFNQEFNLPEEKDVNYTATLFTKDLAGNTIEKKSYFHKDYGRIYRDEEEYLDQELRLESDKEKYRIGDQVKLRLEQAKQLVDKKQVLYITLQGGLRKAVVADNTFEFPFTDQEVPNVAVLAIGFGGYAAEEISREIVKLDTDQKKLEIKATTDKPGYRPGESVKLLLEVKDLAGVPARKGKILVKAIDEALLALMDQEENALDTLYLRNNVPDMGNEYSSHSFQQNFINKRNRGYYFNDMAKSEDMVMMEKSKEDAPNTNSPRVRKNFLDTAVFQLVELDENGKATFEFKMPDNITAWRMMMSAITTDLQAGSGVKNINVSLPFFINAAMNQEYLVGDQVNISATSYGNDLQPNQEVNYKVYLKNKLVYTTKGKAYQRVDLVLPKFTKAEEEKFKIEAYAGKLSDAVEYDLKVVTTHHQKMVNQILPAQKHMKLTSNNQGMTNIYLVDREKSRYIPELYQMNYYYGHRIDQRMVAKLAGELLKQIQGKDAYINPLGNVEISDYQRENGGLSVLPYSDAEVDITVQMLPLLIDKQDSSKDVINRQFLQAYLQSELENQKSREKAMIYYGLAYLDKLKLADLEEYNKLSNLSLSERIYLGLAYAELGDIYTAKQIYSQYVEPKLEKYDKIILVKQGNKDEGYELTAEAMLLAQKIGSADSLKMFEYLHENDSEQVFMGANQLNFMKHQISQISFKDCKIKYRYMGKEREEKLSHYPVVVSVPSTTLSQFDITEVTGDVDIILSYPKSEKLLAKSNQYLKVNRKYLVKGKETKEFKAGDIVEVVINWDISKNAPEDNYRITDYLPAGLKPIENDFATGGSYSYYRWQDIESQKVSIYARYWKGLNSEDQTFKYYARVVSAGDFTAEGVVMQGMNHPDQILVEKEEQIKIR